MPNDNQFLGALIDNRPQEKKEKDIHTVEAFASAAPVEWVEKKMEDFRKFPDQNQDGSGSCVEQTVRKIGGILMYLKEGQYVEMSAGFYKLRSNAPESGMIGMEAFDIWKNEGLPLESLLESDNKNDAAMDAIELPQWKKDVAKVFGIKGHLGIANGDFDTVASVIQQTGKGVMVWFYFHADEWSTKFPTVKRPMNVNADDTLRHSVAAVDFGLINGRQYIKIEDSAHFGGFTERWISREFFEARHWFARYPMNFKFDEETPGTTKPKYLFKNPLDFIPLDENGKISDLARHEAQKADVTGLQNILRYEGFFPANFESTGYYGAATAKAVYNWQVKHKVAPIAELDSIQPKGGRVGIKTFGKLNSLYSH